MQILFLSPPYHDNVLFPYIIYGHHTGFSQSENIKLASTQDRDVYVLIITLFSYIFPFLPIRDSVDAGHFSTSCADRFDWP